MSSRKTVGKRFSPAPCIPYEAMGSLYDHDSHIEPVDGFFRAIRPIVRELNNEPVLDLGCGTGLLAEKLACQGCIVLGIDGASRMLEVARRRCKSFGTRVKFLRANLTRFHVPGLSKAAFASGDVVNHLRSTRQLAEFFRHVRRSLTTGAIFVFDTLNRWCFENYWADRTYFFESGRGDVVMECWWDDNKGIGIANTTVYASRANGGYSRTQTVIYERFFPATVVRRSLRDAGFAKVSAVPWSPWADQDGEEGVDRILWTVVA
jgi:SAM-dependent methyltransferase